VAIYRLIRESVFEPEAIERMTTAYEQALKVLQLTDRQDPITELVAREIIAFAEMGELSRTGFASAPLMPSARNCRPMASDGSIIKERSYGKAIDTDPP
jgi:hypothetical protein